jgi:hypothetical protein
VDDHTVVDLGVIDRGDGSDDYIVDLDLAGNRNSNEDLAPAGDDLTIDSEDSDSLLDPLAYSTSARDRDQSRGMGNYLRAPHAVPSPEPKRTRLNATTLERSPVVMESVLSPPTSIVPTVPPTDSVHEVRRSTRARRPPTLDPEPARINSRPRVPVSQHWSYVVPPEVLQAATLDHNHTFDSSGESPHTLVFGTRCPQDVGDPFPVSPPATDTTLILRREQILFALPTLHPHAQWMLENDVRPPAVADRDWHHSNQLLFANHPRPPLTTDFLTAFSRASADLPRIPFDPAAFYLSDSFPDCFPQPKPPHLNSKVVRRILAAKETIFKYGIYLPRNDGDADRSPERV